MKKIITSEILIAYSQCPSKAFLLMCEKTHGALNEYTEVLKQQRNKIEKNYLESLQKKKPDVQPYDIKILKKKHEFLINATIEAKGLSANCAILKRVSTHSDLGRYSYEPTILIGAYGLKMVAKLELFFASYALKQLQGKYPASGQIIGLDLKSHKVKLGNVSKKLIKLLVPLQNWASETSPKPPPQILNRHCSICQFQCICRAKAEQKDHLSLLDCLSTPKAINKYERKGIFTVNQLSYTFKPRKRKKRAKNPTPLIHKPDLQALAIREKKIYLQALPELNRQPVELFLDIEGIPDQHLYYLFGVLISENGTTKYYPLWADTPAEETNIWQQFQDMVHQYPDIPIYHYGSFESRALSTLAKRYGTDKNVLTDRLVNVIHSIYGKVYFPVYSNRLKEIGRFVGATWTSPDASGIKSLVWRYNWDKTNNVEYKEQLIEYNHEDCEALKIVTDELSRIEHSASTLSEVDFANKPKLQATKIGIGIHNQFESILRSSHFNYKNKKIMFSKHEKRKNGEKKKRGAKIGHKGHQKKIPKTGRVYRFPRRRKCTFHKGEVLQASEKIAERTIIDLVFMKSGVRKTITKYTGIKSYCPKCCRYYNPLGIDKLGNKVFGHNFQSWVIYQRLILRLPYRIITQVIEDQFNESLSQGTIINFLKYFTNFYCDTEIISIDKIRKSPFIHVDETKINIQGIEHYVWVLTDNTHVVFKLTETRETNIFHNILSDYQGILISDFYPGYDSIECKQQKCWAHLLRDINNDLWASPYDTEFEIFVVEVRNMIIPIMEAVQKYGLKKLNLKKFKMAVNKFYKSAIVNKIYKSELTIKYRNRFEKNSKSLFTFLEHNGIPWHNNTAERALRHLAVQRKISGTFFESVTHSYLILLGIMQTCNFQNKSFLKFLLSGDKDVDQFNYSKRRNRNTN